MKKFLYLLLSVLCVGCSQDNTPHEGDIIFQTETNSEGVAWRNLTKSDITHCGIVVEKEDGSLLVLHMHNRMMLTPLSSFIKHGFKEQYRIGRATNKKVEIDYLKYMSAEKDYRLRLNDRDYYNAELVYRIYKEELGIELCTPRPLSEYRVDSTMVGFNLPPHQPIVTPVDLYNSPLIKTIQTRYKEQR